MSTPRIHPDKFYGYLDTADICQLLGQPATLSARRLVYRQIRAREKRDGVTIFHQKEGGKMGSTCRTTLPLLRNHFPEWFSNRDHMAEMIDGKLEAYDRRFKEHDLLFRVLGARIREWEEWAKALPKAGLT